MKMRLRGKGFFAMFGFFFCFPSPPTAGVIGREAKKEEEVEIPFETIRFFFFHCVSLIIQSHDIVLSLFTLHITPLSFYSRTPLSLPLSFSPSLFLSLSLSLPLFLSFFLSLFLHTFRMVVYVHVYVHTIQYTTIQG